MANDKLGRMFGQVRPSPEREEAMLAELLREEEREVRPMRRDWRRTAVIALIAAVLLAAAALAVATVLDPAFLEHFGAGPKDEPLLGKTAVDVNLTAEPRELVPVGNGYAVGGPATEDTGTFSIRQAVVDRYSARFLIDYTAPEGMVLDGDYYFTNADYILRGDEDWDIILFNWTSRWELVEDDDPADGKITILLTLLPADSGGELSGRRLLIGFHKLYEAESQEASYDRENRTEVVHGAWYFPIFTLPEDPGVYYPVEQTVEIGGQELDVKSVYLSPISLVLDLAQEDVKRKDSLLGAKLPPETWDEDVVLQAGRRERIHMVEPDYPNISAASGMPYQNSRGTVYAHFYYRPERIIDPAEIKAVEFFGQTIDLK